MFKDKNKPHETKKHEYIHFTLKIFLIIIYIITTLSFFGYVLTRFSIKSFGDLPLSQLLFHLTAGGTGHGINTTLLNELIKWIGYFCLFFIAQTVLLLVAINHKFRQLFIKLLTPVTCPVFNFLKDWRVIFLIFSLGIVLPTTHYMEKKLHIVTYLTQEDSNWFENHYAELDTQNVQFVDRKKRNLIVIFLESMEIGFRDATYFEENLTPELVALESEGGVFRGYQRTPGSYFTIDGLSAQLLGVPVIAQDFQVHGGSKYQAFLAKVPSVFNVLKNQGYLTTNFSGVTKEFTSKGDYFKDHGITDLHFLEEWLAAGYKLDDYTKGTWDFNDHFLWERLKEWLSSSENQKQPFAVVFETVDTHQPNGWVPTELRQYNDLRDAIKLSSKMTFDFIQWAKTQPWYENTVIVILGDHPWPDPPTSSFSKLSSKNQTREIYNLFLNSPYIRPGTIITPQGGFTPMDIAPTILGSLGIQFTSRLVSQSGTSISESKMGLGTNLLSTDLTIISQEGLEPFNEELLKKRSHLYQSLFW